jgi:periplasmic protein TonB
MNRLDWSLRSVALVISLLFHGVFFLTTGSVAGNSEQAPAQRKVTRVSFRSEVAPQAPPLPQPKVPEPKIEPKKNKAKKQRKPEPKVEVPKPPSAPTAEAKVAGTVDDQAFIEKARQKYLRQLMAHIEGYKNYPKAARRRRIEGDVKVAFTLQSEGRVASLSAGGAHALLNDAANAAVIAAQPMPQPPETVKLPWQISFTMRFTIK